MSEAASMSGLAPNPILPEHLVSLAPTIKPDRAVAYAHALNFVLSLAEITTPLRLAYFVSQLAYESASFRALTENLNYSASRLLVIFPKYVKSQAQADSLARQGPEAIANLVYGGRMGNGPAASGDGWAYRGRGFIMLTGKDNYRRFQTFLGLNVVTDPDMVADPYVAAQAAAWFWLGNGLNALADRDDVSAVTRRINGGTHGLEGRARLLARAKAIWAADSAPTPSVPVT
jgi:putative chitinase